MKNLRDHVDVAVSGAAAQLAISSSELTCVGSKKGRVPVKNPKRIWKREGIARLPRSVNPVRYVDIE